MNYTRVVSFQAPKAIIKSFRTCCRTILLSSKDKGLAYAVGYARAGLDLSTSAGIHTQCLYILGNITHWRKDPAATVRKELKAIAAALAEDKE